MDNELICPKCQSYNVIVDFSSNTLICRDCPTIHDRTIPQDNEDDEPTPFVSQGINIF